MSAWRAHTHCLSCARICSLDCAELRHMCSASTSLGRSFASAAQQNATRATVISGLALEQVKDIAM
jgi:hypothetical protein